jgi:putative hemolysin
MTPAFSLARALSPVSSLASRASIAVAGLLLGLAGPAAAATTAPATASPAAAAASYCSATGGVAATMHPYSNTNSDPSLWLRWGGAVQACTYTADDSSRITIWASTLHSAKPTMAALAYYAKVAPSAKLGGNPAPAYCLQLGGAWQVGNGFDGGGWSAQRDGSDWVYSMCHFADGSAIDDWGLLYHAYDIVRGKDLSTVLKFPNPY